MLCFVLAVLALVAQQDTTRRPPPPDTASVGDDAEEAVAKAAEDVQRFRVRPIISPTSVYSPSKGFGLGGGVAVDGVLSQDDHLQVEGRVAQHLQGVFTEYITGRPTRSPLYALLGATAWTTDRTPFYGLGPHSPVEGHLYLDRFTAGAEARLGWTPHAPGSLLLQPTVRLRFDRLRGFEEVRPGGLAAVRPGELESLERLVGADRYGVELALSAIRDTRDLPAMPARGSYLQAEVGRFQATDGSGLGFTRIQATAYTFRPALFRVPFFPERGALFFRANGMVTREDGEAPLPWFYLQELDRDLLVGYPRSQFVGRDALSVGVGVRGVIGQAIGAFLFEGVAMTMVGAAYDDVFRQFSPRVRFSNDRPADGEPVPLRPSMAVGMNFHFIDRERPIVGGLVGIGPEGVSLVSLRLIYGFQGYRPVFR